MKKINLIIISLVLMFSGCITSSNKNRGSLSDAMDKSRDDYEEERVVPDEDDYWDDDDDYWDDDDEYDTDVYVAVTNDLDLEDLVLIIRSGTSLLSGPYFNKSTGAEILLGGVNDGSTEFFFYGGLEILELNKNHSISESIKENPFMLTVGLEVRYYPINDLEYFTPYILARAGGLILAWQFENALIAGSDIIRSDSVGGFTLDVGIGMDIIHNDRIRFGILCKPQSYLYGIETIEGFTNDYFDVSGLINISAEIGYKF